jgi:hypothetical protein
MTFRILSTRKNKMLKLQFPDGRSLKHRSESATCTVRAFLDQIKAYDPTILSPELLIGFPPKLLLFQNIEDPLEKYIPNGSVIVIREKSPEPTARRYIIPADNSCLFHAIRVAKHLNDISDRSIREIISSVIRNDSEKYNSTFLGKDPSEYCEWILQPSSWGGEIECKSREVLSESHISSSEHLKSIFCHRNGCGGY